MMRKEYPLYLAIVLTMAAVFALDLVLPLGGAAGVLYLLAVLLCMRTPGWRTTVVVAALASALTIAGHFLAPPAGTPWTAMANRVLAIIVIWVSAWLLIGRRRIGDALRESGRRLRTVFETVPDGVVIIDESGVIEYFNPAAQRLFGYTQDEAVGRNVSMLMPEAHGSKHDSYLARYLATGDRRIIGIGREVVATRKDGNEFPVRLAVGEVDTGGRKTFTGIVHDLTEFRSVEKASMEDAATGLANRRAFDEMLVAALSRGQTSLILIDVDNLKLINDELGHIRGDKAITAAALGIVANVRSTDPGVCARIGGDEFAVVLPHTGKYVAMRIADRILATAKPTLQAIHSESGVSIGVATADRETEPKALISQADEALYRAKEMRGQVRD